MHLPPDETETSTTTRGVKTKLMWLASIVGSVLALDLWTKRWALETLGAGERIDLFGGVVPLTLAFNRGAAFGISIGNDPRWFFIPVTLLALGLMVVLFVRAHPTDRLRLGSLALVMAGALGNLYDRLRWDRGVVDFIGPVDLGFMLWPIFNVADMAITCGAVLLAISFWLEEKAALEREAELRRSSAPGAKRSGPEGTGGSLRPDGPTEASGRSSAPPTD